MNVAVARAAGVLANDVDLDGPIPIPIVSGGITSTNGAAVVLNADGSFSYDPTSADILQGLDDGESIVDTFTYGLLGSGSNGDGPFNYDFGDDPSLQGWTLLNGEAFFRASGGGGLSAGNGA
ncbi:MAG: Ig-like domain-containing protein, partial [Pseudomonadota bacterium]